MTVENQTNKIRESGNGVTDIFNFPFKIFEKSNIQVFKIDTSVTPENPVLQVVDVDYTVAISTTVEGGSITYTVPPTSIQDSFIKRELPLTQEKDFPPNINFPEQTIEDEYDKSRMIDIQLKEVETRTLILNEFTQYVGSLEIPEPEAGKVIGFDATGLVIALFSGSDLDTVLTTVFGQQLVQSADALTARNFLELGAANDVIFNQITASTYVGLPDLEKYWGWGFVPSSSSGNPDEDVDITIGKMLCEDGTTIVELVSLETDLSFPTLLGGVLANDTTYHLFRYLKNDDTSQWHLNTSLSPVIGDIKSPLAFRRIYSAKTDGSADLQKVFSKKLGGGGLYIYFDEFINDYNTSPTTSETLTTISVPSGLELLLNVSIIWATMSAGAKTMRIYNPNILNVALVTAASSFRGGVGGDVSDDTINIEVLTNTSGQIAHRASSTSGTLFINLIAFKDMRNQF